jgi:hypothetical protein
MLTKYMKTKTQFQPETLEEQKQYHAENAKLLEKYEQMNFQSAEEAAQYALSHGGCTIEDFREEVLKKIRDYYKQK